MASMCTWCGKQSQFGKSYTHHRGVAGGRWKKRAQKTNRIFKVNLQRVTVVEGDFEMQTRLCGKCIKRIKKDTVDGVKPFLNLKQLQVAKEAQKKDVVEKTSVEDPPIVATA